VRVPRRAQSTGVVAGALAVVAALALPAAATARFTVEITSSGFTYAGNPVSDLTVALGDRVQFCNRTNLFYDVTVDGRDYGTLAPTLCTPNDFTDTAGSHRVVASTGVPTLPADRMTVRTRAAAPSPSPPVPPPASPSASPSAPASVSPSAPASPAATPAISSAPSAAPSRSPRPSGPVTRSPTPPAAPSASPSPSAVVLGGPLQPPSPRGQGLPAALAAVLAIGVLGGIVRVLLAEPVTGGTQAVG